MDQSTSKFVNLCMLAILFILSSDLCGLRLANGILSATGFNVSLYCLRTIMAMDFFKWPHRIVYHNYFIFWSFYHFLSFFIIFYHFYHFLSIFILTHFFTGWSQCKMYNYLFCRSWQSYLNTSACYYTNIW